MTVKIFHSFRRLQNATMWLTLLFFVVLTGCSGYDLDERSPAWLGESIYDYLAHDGHYNYTVRLIQDLNYQDVLGRTGSKTLFVADDDAWDRFFKNNVFGAHSYEQLSLSQKKMLLFGSMINNSFQVGNLSSTEGPTEGDCMRRLSSQTLYDSVPVLAPSQMPASHYWDRYRKQGNLVCMEDMSTVPMVHFIEAFLNNSKITNDDYNFLYNNTVSRQAGDASVNGVKIEEQNIKCSNGFVHKMAEVITPLPNLAELIRSKSQCSLFNHLMEHFCAPYYNREATEGYNRLYGTSVDSVFQKRFFSKKSQGGEELNRTPDNEVVSGQLKFDPEWNSYYSGAAQSTSAAVALEKDMGVIMVSSDQALTEYWERGAGRVLKDRYGTWDNVPDNVLVELINNNMLSSFVGSVPSKFSNILNDANDEMGVTRDAIDSVWLGCNGAVYLTNRVYSPTAYVSVSFPTLVNDNMSVVHWGIEDRQYNVYLNSLNSRFSFFVPNNEAVLNYVDPVSYGKPSLQLFRFHYNTRLKTVWASVWNYDAETGTVGDSIREASTAEVSNRLLDILRTHVVVGNVEDGNTYYRTMGGTEIRVDHARQGAGAMTVAGSLQVNEGRTARVSYIYDQSAMGNGKTYILNDEPIMTTRHTVRDILAAHSEYSKFLELMDGSGLFETIHNNKYACGGTNISLFNTYHYTVYVPTNELIEKLQKQGKLPTWTQVDNEEGTRRTKDSLSIVNFVKYHIQDNAVFIGGGTTSADYETSCINNATGRFYKISVQGNNDGITLRDVVGNTRHVLTSNASLYNQQAREYQYNTQDAMDARLIETSSSAVVHLIDAPLMYK